MADVGPLDRSTSIPAIESGARSTPPRCRVSARVLGGSGEPARGSNGGVWACDRSVFTVQARRANSSSQRREIAKVLPLQFSYVVRPVLPENCERFARARVASPRASAASAKSARARRSLAALRRVHVSKWSARACLNTANVRPASTPTAQSQVPRPRRQIPDPAPSRCCASRS